VVRKKGPAKGKANEPRDGAGPVMCAPSARSPGLAKLKL